MRIRPPTMLALLSLALLACSRNAYPIHTEIGPDGGGVSISGRTNGCPVVTADVEPSIVHWGDAVKASAYRATDPDNEVLTYQWSAPTGTFVDARAGETYFMCADAGPVTLTVVVTDRSGCSEETKLGIFCLGKGDGGAAGTGPGPISGAAGSGGSSDGGVVVPPPQENMCPKEQGSDQCNECTATNCSLGDMGTDGCCGLTDEADRKLCGTVSRCIAQNAPSCVMSGDATVCFCGTSGPQCFAQKGKANGPCAAEVIAAAKTDDVALIQERFISVKFPIGRAINLSACRGAFCGMECGY